jgi:hypothetical protein
MSGFGLVALLVGPEDVALYSANVLRPAGSPLIWQNPKSTLRRAPRPPISRQLSVIKIKNETAAGREGWVCHAVRSRRSPQGGGHERSDSPALPDHTNTAIRLAV